MSSCGIFAGIVESTTSVVSLILLDQRSEVDHAFIPIDLYPVLELPIPTTEHWRHIIILNQPSSTTLWCDDSGHNSDNANDNVYDFVIEAKGFQCSDTVSC